MKKIEKTLITGGCGFLGTNLVDKMQDMRQVSVFDFLQRSSPTGWPKQDIPVHKSDISDQTALDAALKGMHSVIHLAAYGSVVESVANPQWNFETNVAGTLGVLQAAVRANVQRLIFASTGGALIGDATPPVDEGSLPKPISPYGASKLCGEAYCHAFAKSYGLETVCLRFGNLYGPHSAHKKGAVTMFMKALMTDQPIVIYGDGAASRDYIYVDDLCEGIKSALDVPIDGAEVFHLASGRETTILELVDILREIAGKPTHPVEFRAARRGEVTRNFARCDKAERVLGFVPKVSLEDGLARTYQWFEAHRDVALGVSTSDS